MAKYTDLQRVFSKITGGRPIVAAALAGLGSGALARLIGPWLARGLLFGGTPALSVRGISIPSMAALQLSPEEERRMKNRLMLMGGLLGASPWLYLVARNIQDKGISGLWEPMKKKSELIPFGDSLEIIEDDPHLTPFQRAVVERVFMNAADRANLSGGPEGKLQGLISTQDLIAGAVGAGLGLGGGALVGSLLSDVFALPPAAVRRLSMAGGLAGLLYGAGIIG